MLSVGLTGGVAAGKSVVAARWADRGVPVVSADQLARDVVGPGTPGLAEVRSTFGDRVLAADGSLDRGALRALVFADDEARGRLEALLHPRIRAARERWIEARRGEGAGIVVSEIPLLFETSLQGDFDVTVLVTAPDEERVRRMVEERGLSSSEAHGILAAQMSQEEKRALADVVIDNAGTLDELHERADEVLDRFRSGEPASTMLMDLHLHTAASFDCLSDPERVLERMLASGYDRIAITDHNRIDAALWMADRHPERIVPGEEVKTAEGIDVIGLYMSEEIPKGTPARETIERIRDQGAIPYLPHPYAGGKGGGGKMADELAALCDVVEVFNARLHDPTSNPRARELAHRHGKLPGGGSDAHTFGELGNVRVVVPAHPNRPEALLGALADARIEGREAPHYVHLGSTWAKVRKKLPGGQWRPHRGLR